jgi:hypothetical protein
MKVIIMLIITFYNKVLSDPNPSDKLDPDPHQSEAGSAAPMIDNQCGGSGMFIPDPDFYPSRIPDTDPGSKNSNKSGVKITGLGS